MFRAAVRSMSTTARKSLTIGLIPADGIGREVIPVRRSAEYRNTRLLSPDSDVGREASYPRARIGPAKDGVRRAACWI